MIRELLPQDIPALAAFFSGLDSAKWAVGLSPADIEKELRRRLLKKSHTSSILVSENDKAGLDAYCAVHWIPSLVLPGTEGYVSELFVAAPARGQGLGTALLERVETMAREHGCHRLSLLNLKDKPAYQRGFYAKRNWTERTKAANMIKEFPPE